MSETDSIITKPEWNKEWEMPSWPLPANWTDAAALSKDGVVLFGNPVSPPCAKIITILSVYGVKYTLTDKKPKEGYQKMPILWIGDKQINDSSVIVRVLAKVLAREYSEEETALEIHTSKGLMLGLEAAVAGSRENLNKCGRSIGGCVGFMMGWIFCCCIPCGGFKTKMLAAYPGFSDLTMAQHAEKYNQILASKNKAFFSTEGDAPGFIDWSIFALVKHFADADIDAAKEFIGQKELASWYKEMDSRLKNTSTTESKL